MEDIETRNKEIVRRHLEEGKSFAAIGADPDINLSRQRVSVIIREAGISPEKSREVRRRARLVKWACGNPDCDVERRVPASRAGVIYCSDACRAAGMDVGPKYEEEELIEHFRQLAVKLGHTPRQEDIMRAEGPSLGTYYGRLDSLTKVAKTAGLEPNVPFQSARPLPEGFRQRFE